MLLKRHIIKCNKDLFQAGGGRGSRICGICSPLLGEGVELGAELVPVEAEEGGGPSGADGGGGVVAAAGELVGGDG